MVRRIKSDRPKSSWASATKVLGFAWLVRKPVQMLLEYYQERKEEQHKRERRLRILKKTMIALLVLLGAALLFAGTVRGLVALKVLSLDNVLSVASEPIDTDEDGHTNLLLLGTGDESHDGVDLTDTIIIASLDPKNTKTVGMISIPRDLYMTSDTMGSGRINALYRDYKWWLYRNRDMEESAASKEALRQLMMEMEDLMDIDLHGVIKADFIGFKDVVDAVGGFTIDVPERLYDAEYPNGRGGYEVLFIEEGTQEFDGELALKYARSRHSTSDFDRSRRQQMIIKALGEKMKEEGVLSSPNTILELMRIASEHVETTLTSGQIVSLARMGRDIDREHIISFQINDRSGFSTGVGAQPGGFLYTPPRADFGGASVLLPASLGGQQHPWDQIRLLADLAFGKRALYINDPVVDVLNAGAPSGSSRFLAGELTRYGIQVGEVENAESRDSTQSFIFYDEPRKVAAEALSNALQIPSTLSASASGSIVVSLGENYDYTPLVLLTPEEAPTPSVGQ